MARRNRSADHNYILAKSLPVECGVNRVLIRSTTKAGKVNLIANAEGLKSAVLDIETTLAKVDAGLNKQWASDGLKPSLSRGETPQTPSFVATRKSLEIADIVAGANQEKAQASIDDNELSDWINDGKINTAWIKYTLKAPSTVDEVNIKLNNFRTKCIHFVFWWMTKSYLREIPKNHWVISKRLQANQRKSHYDSINE
jgi:hypothetical protein